MRVAIDARMIQHGSMHGIARYVYELLKGMNHLESKIEFFVIINANSPLLLDNSISKIEKIVISSSWISFGEQVELPSVLKTHNIDLFHTPSFVAPLIVPCKLVMTIHDLNHMVLPQFYTWFHQLYYKLVVHRSVFKSECILTVSEFSKKEIMRTLGLGGDKIFVTYNGVSETYKVIDDELMKQYIREIYGLPEKFIFCVSNNKPHKNITQLVRAYCYSDIDTPLVLACPVDYNLIKIAESHNKKHLIYFSKFINEKHLPVLYSMTELFVYPSTYEGFGLPPLEALACGAPIVVSQSSSLPEVVGDCAVFANPYDYRDIARALEQGLNDENVRENLKSRGIKHSSKFSWDKMCRETFDIYMRTLDGEI